MKHAFLIFLLALGIQNRALEADLYDDLVPHFQVIRNEIERLPVAWEHREPLHQALDRCQQQVNEDRLEFFAIHYLMESFLAQYAHILLPLLFSGEVDEGAIDAVLQEVDYIEAQLFFAYGPLQVVEPGSVPVPDGGCNVAILLRTLNDYLANPAGAINAHSTVPLQFEAQGEPAGGTWQWRMEPEYEDAWDYQYAQSNRFSFRPTGLETLRLTVVYTTSSGAECQDTVWIKVQSHFEPRAWPNGNGGSN